MNTESEIVSIGRRTVWTEEQLLYLAANSKTMSIEVIAASMGRKPSAIRARIAKLKLPTFPLGKSSAKADARYKGTRIGMLTFIERVAVTRRGYIWRFKCDCGYDEYLNLAVNVDVAVKDYGHVSCGCSRKKRGGK